jgi:hypothetical protein
VSEGFKMAFNPMIFWFLGLTNAQRHAEEAHLDLPDNDLFLDPLADVLEGNVRAEISNAGEDFAPEQARASNRELWQALRDSHKYETFYCQNFSLFFIAVFMVDVRTIVRGVIARSL